MEIWTQQDTTGRSDVGGVVPYNAYGCLVHRRWSLHGSYANCLGLHQPVAATVSTSSARTCEK